MKIKMIISENDLEVFCKKYSTSEKIVRTKCLSIVSFEVLFLNGTKYFSKYGASVEL